MFETSWSAMIDGVYEMAPPMMIRHVVSPYTDASNDCIIVETVEINLAEAW